MEKLKVYVKQLKGQIHARYQINTFGKVISLWNISFTKRQYKLLKTLSPMLERYNKSDVINVFKEFKRKIKLKAHFVWCQPINLQKKCDTKKSTKEPNKNHHTVKNFTEAISNDIKNLLTKKTTLLKSNLSIQEKEALKKLANRDDSITSKGDKEATQKLEDTFFYQKLTINPALEYNTRINIIIDNFKKQNPITQKNSKFIEIKKSKNTKVLQITKNF